MVPARRIPHSLTLLGLPTPRSQPSQSLHRRFHLISASRLRPDTSYVRKSAGSGHAQTRRWLRGQVYLFTKYTVYTSIFIVFGAAAGWWITQEAIERTEPTPSEWSFGGRVRARVAWAAAQDGVMGKRGRQDWLFVARSWKQLLHMLEMEGLETQSLEVVDESSYSGARPAMPNGGQVDELLVVYDISKRPEPWIRGYANAMLGLAKAAENLEDYVVDATRNEAFHAQYMVGPSNPHPVEMPRARGRPPKEEDCTPACELPDVIYQKALHTRGFNDRQRIDILLACSDYLAYKSRFDEAKAHIVLAKDIAQREYQKENGQMPLAPSSENLVKVYTAEALTSAQSGEPSQALRTALQTLSAWREAPMIPVSSKENLEPPPPIAKTDVEAFFNWFRSLDALLSPPPYPPPPPTGNELLTRPVVAGRASYDASSHVLTKTKEFQPATCLESTLLSYIGEILFASSASSRESGLRMTKEAINLAKTVAKNDGVDYDERKHCAQCVEVGLANWSSMVEKMKTEAADQSIKPAKHQSWKTWLGSTASQDESGSHWQQEQEELHSFAALWEHDAVLDKLNAGRSRVWANPLIFLPVYSST